MIPKVCKRLAEVDFPIAVVSKHSAREKSIRHGHPSTLHLWWARRPLAACRAMLLALLWPDPCDVNCPQDFKDKARELLSPLPGKVGSSDEDLRKALLKFIGDFADWDRSADPIYLEASRALVKAAHEEEPPLVVDPFAGGGSIPLEAIRVGCEAFASDLNPVACLILKIILEDIPGHGPALADELRNAAHKVKSEVRRNLAKFYPQDAVGSRPIAYIWARTVQCEAPGCGAEIPLMRSSWLCRKPNRKRALRCKVIRAEGARPRVEFEIFEPTSDSEVQRGTVTQARATCPCCGVVLEPDRVRAQLVEQKGGARVTFDLEGNRIAGAALLAVVELRPGEAGRFYRLPTLADHKALASAQEHLDTKIKNSEAVLIDRKSLMPVPNELLPPIGTLGFRVQRYGMLQWGDIFSDRQKLVLSTLAETIAATDGSETLKKLLAITLSHTLDRSTSLCLWRAEPYMETVEHVFGRQALPMIWDFAESMVLSESTGSFEHGLGVVSQCVETNPVIFGTKGQVQCSDATSSPLSDQSSSIWFTDPPYYDAVPYADLSDFFYVWLKRAFPDCATLRDPFDETNPLTPKEAEIVEDEAKRFLGRVKNRAFFEERMGTVFLEGRRVLMDDGIGCVVFAHKTTEGWEALLSGLIAARWVITASWPIATEMQNRLRARDSAALATSVHLVCRPRPEDAPIGDWSEVLRELPKRVGNWMERLQSEHIRGADLVFACIGPALEIFSRYSRVETAEGTEITLAQYLQKVWEVVGRSALAQVLGTAEAKARNGAAGALEEDARLTALFLWTLQSTNGEGGEESKKVKGKTKKGEIEEEEIDDEGDEDEESSGKGKPKGFTLIFDVARRFAQPLGIHLPDWEGRIIETKKGIVRLLPVTERARQLFGTEGTKSVAERIDQDSTVNVQGLLFPEMEVQAAPKVRGGRRQVHITDETMRTHHEATTLDRVHAAMLLQAGGKSNALRALIKEELDRGSDFLRLANALSALYPRSSEEKRLIDAMLLALPR